MSKRKLIVFVLLDTAKISKVKSIVIKFPKSYISKFQSRNSRKPNERLPEK